MLILNYPEFLDSCYILNYAAKPRANYKIWYPPFLGAPRKAILLASERDFKYL